MSKKPNSERWKPVAAVPYRDLYEVSDLGRIRSLHAKWSKPRMLNPSVGNAGYRIVVLSSEGKTKTLRVTMLVVGAFLTPCPEGYVCQHIDGEKTNDRLDNLRYVRIGRVIKDRGFVPHERNALHQEDYDRIHELYAQGLSQCEIGRRVGCHNSLVSRIVRGLQTNPRLRSDEHKRQVFKRWQRAYYSDPAVRKRRNDKRKKA